MIPIYDNFPPNKTSERDKHFQEEIKAFMDCDCKFAYVDIDENVTMSRNRELYKRALRKMMIFDVEVRQINKKMYLTKKGEKWLE